MKLALIGCGGMGALHAAMARAAGFEVILCADTVEPAARSMAEKYQARWSADPETAARDPEAQVVAIATPTPTHLPLIRIAAESGKHIFCEKPFCRTVRECREAIRLAKKHRIKLFIGHVVRYFQEFEAMRQKIQEGRIGEVGWVKLTRGGIMPGAPGSWFRDYAQSGGVTLDCMIHDLDWLRYVFGEPKRVYAQALMRGEPNPMDYAQATLRFRNGLIATVIGIWAYPSGFRVTAEICGDKGMLQYDSSDAPLSLHSRSVSAGPTMIVPLNPVEKSPYLLEWEDFAAWLSGKGTPKVTPEDAMAAVAMAEAALESAEKGQPVRFPGRICR
ncbi:MAG TPA: Gfo/Idh/MocA family oxidoreductase [Candidatus Hydrogenedentes bacterium]|nr:Gfo/Idh/MocA family oxidoreductase [Candidatus Hydrogenedentota bacterium]HPU97762.1 Gfo/Idh/MocA family oxidoreductase [Candidatus Hydrogenedentota bacterium]